MKKGKRRIICTLFFISIIILWTLSPKTSLAQDITIKTKLNASPAQDTTIQTGLNTSPDISAPSAILMEASTGIVVYEKDADIKLHPASITKIMTLILIFDALAEEKITLNDTVTVSEYAASMGGSQVFLEPGETQTVNTMIKCISIASANDACVAYMDSRHYAR